MKTRKKNIDLDENDQQKKKSWKESAKFKLYVRFAVLVQSFAICFCYSCELPLQEINKPTFLSAYFFFFVLTCQ